MIPTVSVSRPPFRRGGFTLIEVLLALAILAVIMTMVYSSFDQTSRLARHIDAVSDPYRVGRLVLAKLSDELRSTYVLDGVGYFEGEDGVAEDGLDADRLRFTSLSGNRRRGPASHHNALTYELVGHRLMHTEILNTLGTGFGNEETFPVVEGLAGFQLRYLSGRDDSWGDGWSSEGGGSQPLPRAVSVTLVFADPLEDDGDADTRRDRPAEPLTLSTVIRIPMAGGA